MNVDLDNPSPLAIVEGREAKLLSFDLAHGDRTTHIFGMQHFALQSFFDERRLQLQRHPDAVLLKEGLDFRNGLTEIPEYARELVSFVEDGIEAIRALMKEEFANQVSAFTLDQLESIQADFDLAEFCQDMGMPLRLIRETMRHNPLESLKLASEDTIAKMRREYKKETVYGMNLDSCPPELQIATLIKNARACIMFRLDDRNKRLVEHIEATRESKRDSLVPWGAFHLPGINKLLTANGWSYVPGSKNYTTFMHLED